MSTHHRDYIIGSDETGYGAWSGPLFVCAVAVLKTWKGPEGLTDSKLLSSAERAMLYGELQHLPMSIIVASNTVIDELGVKTALLSAHTTAIKKLLEIYPDADIVVDGVLPLPELPQARCVPKADALFPAVSAASVIAKVNRDFLMHQYHHQFPYYGWDTNAGYGTKSHQRGLKEHGVCALHRRSYAPIKKLLETA